MAIGKGKGSKGKGVGNYVRRTGITNISTSDYGYEGRSWGDGKTRVTWTPEANPRNIPTGYKVYVNGVLKATVPYGTNLVDLTGLSTGGANNISVVPYDTYVEQIATETAATVTGVPATPAAPTATNVGTSRPFNNGAISVAFTAPSDNGGSAVTSYTVSAYCSVHAVTHTATGASSPLVITGFGSGVVTTATVKATNVNGSSAASPASSSVTITTVPATMSAPGATAGVDLDTISWTAPSNGGTAIIDYYIESNDSKNKTVTQADSGSTTLAQEANTAQQYRVRARNANGSSDFSGYSGSVTTQAPSFFSPPFFPPGFFSPPFFPPGFFSPPFFPPGFFSPPFFPPGFFSPPFFPPGFFSPPGFGGGYLALRGY